MPQIDLSILNQRQTPAFYADVLANRPAAGFIGRIFVSTNTFEFYRDNGTGWNLIGGPGAGTVTGSGAAGQVSFWNGASTITGSNDLFWDNVNGHLGIGTITPGTALSIAHDQNQVVQLNQTTATNDTKIAFQNSGTALWRIGNSYGGGTNRFVVTDAALNINRFSVLPSSGQTFVGDVVTSSGLFVVNSNSGDAHIVALGATAPSIRVRNAGTGATLQFGLGLATTTNNFIQGSTGGEFCIFNDSLTAQPILFGIKDAGSGNTLEAARISAARNFLVGGTTDTGQKIQITGTSLLTGFTTITGSTTASAGTARGAIISSTLIAAANGDTLVGLDIDPIFVAGAFSGLSRYSARFNNSLSNQSLGLLSYSLPRTNNGGLTLISSIAGTETPHLSLTAGTVNGSIWANTARLNFSVTSPSGVGDPGGVFLFRTDNRASKFAVVPTSASATADASFYGQAIWDGGAAAIFRANAGTQSVPIFRVQNQDGTTNHLVVSNVGNTLLNTATDAGYKLDVAGTTRFQGTSRIDGDLQMFYTGVNSRSFNFYQQFGSSTLELQMTFSTSGSSNRVTLAGVNNELDFFNVTSNKAAGATTTDHIFGLGSTTKGFLPPRMTTVQKNAIRLNGGTSLTPGLMVYDTTLNKLSVYTGAGWETVTSV